MRVLLNETIRLYQVIKNINQTDDRVIELVIPDESIFHHNKNNISYIQEVAQQLGKQVQIRSESDMATGEPVNPGLDVGAVTPVVAPKSGTTSKEQEQPTKDDLAQQTKDTKRKKMHFSVSPKKIFLVVSILLFLIVGGGGAFVVYYLPKATVTLLVSKRVLEHSTTVVVDQDLESVNASEAVVPGRKVSTSLSRTHSFTATGEKTIGDQATGVVELRNFTTGDISLGAGTKIGVQMSDGVTRVFTLTSGVTVPQASTEDDVRIAGKIDANVIASDIGEQYNLSADNRFWVADFDTEDLSAVNREAFTGGTTEQVTIVSADDRTKAQDQLTEELKADLIKRLTETIGEDELFEEDSVSYATRSIEFEAEVGDEVSSFSATQEVEATALVISKNDIKLVLKKELATNIPDGFTLSSEGEVVTVQDTEVVNDVVQVKAKISSIAVPVIDTRAIHDELVGKKPYQAELILQGIDNVQGYEINYWPLLPGPLQTLPYIADRLILDVQVID